MAGARSQTNTLFFCRGNDLQTAYSGFFPPRRANHTGYWPEPWVTAVTLH